MDKNFNKMIGARIREQREFLKLTREDVCGLISMSPQFLSEIERGVKGASAETICKICEGLGVSADCILLGKKRPPDVSNISATLGCLDPKYIPLAEDMLKTFFKAVSMK